MSPFLPRSTPHRKGSFSFPTLETKVFHHSRKLSATHLLRSDLFPGGPDITASKVWFWGEH